MGNLIFFEDHHPGIGCGGIARQRTKGQSLIPLQLALNEYDIERCFALLSGHGKCPVYPRANPNDEGRILFLVRIDDAIAVNQRVLEAEVDEQAVADRIDLIQMLENCEESLLSKAWDQIGTQARRRNTESASSVSHVGR